MSDRDVLAGDKQNPIYKKLEIPGFLAQPPLETFQFSCCVHPIEEQLRNLDRLRTNISKYGAGHSAAYKVYLVTSQILKYLAIPDLVQYPSEWLSLVSALKYGEPWAVEQVVSRIASEQGRGFIEQLSWYYFECSLDPWKGGDSWGELNLAKDPNCLEQALLLMQIDSFQAALWNTLQAQVAALSVPEHHLLYRAIYVAAGRPETTDLCWGEHHLFDERDRLVRALHCIGKFGLGSHTAEYYAEWEHGLEERSAILEIAGKAPKRGQIGLVVGPGDSQVEGCRKALHFQESCLKGHQLSYLFVGSQGDRDRLGPLYHEQGVLLPAGKLLLHKWAEFFAAEAHAKYLQICVGSGAFEVQAALGALPEYLRHRILVIAIEPTCPISDGMCFEAISLQPEQLPGESDDSVSAEGFCPAKYRSLVGDLIESYLWLNSLRSGF
jgi:hypothetical protein